MTELEYLLSKLQFDMDLVERAIINSNHQGDREYIDLLNMLIKLGYKIEGLKK